MVTQRSPAYAQPPPKVPVRPRRSIGDAGGVEPGEGVWEDVASPYQHAKTSSSLDDMRREATPQVLRPDGSVSRGAANDDEDNAWDDERIRPGGTRLLDQVNKVPDSLMPGGGKPGGTNPFLRKPLPQTSAVIPPAVAVQPIAESLSNLDISDSQSNDNPWHSAEDGEYTHMNHHQAASVALSDMGTDPWARSVPESPTKEQHTPARPQSPAMISVHSEGSGWEDAGPSGKEKAAAPPRMTTMTDELLREEHVWDDQEASGSSLGRPKAVEPRAEGLSAESTPLDDWNLVDPDPSSGAPQDEPPPVQPDEQILGDEKPPLPSRSPGETTRWTSPRLLPDGSSETYQVKNIQWYDGISSSNPRVSPILVQNENGPCPLVALVNALTLTTPAENSDTILVQVLRSREQVSLRLLLDAVFDELMSPRRTTLDDSLPDISDLYAFLQSLHTGMNVNPRFIPTPEMVDAFNHTSLTHLDPDERSSLVPGTFENTLEMSLYAAFSIPLIHGWLPPEDGPAHAAMERHAASYEDVQNLLFREEELEHKLSSDVGLTEAEQNLYQDIVTIRMFLESSATQLTPWGIEVIGKAMRPGTFAILFRNDHFATLYRHPETFKLFTLVTDAGYKSHDEIVWESLLDVNGEFNEFLDGHFRATNGRPTTSPSDSHKHSEEQGVDWTQATNGRGKTKELDEGVTSVEQEDRDLALALQLQEEEEQQHRQEQARRKRETILSERYIEQQARRPVPVNPRGRGAIVPQRISSSSVNGPVMGMASRMPDQIPRHPITNQPLIQQVRPLVPPRRQGVSRPAAEDTEPPPPSYEQAAQNPPYIPPPGHPNHPSSSPASARRDPRASAASIGSNPHGPRPGGPLGGRRPVAAGAGPGVQSRGDRECVIM